jgi:CHAT domain-containing protein
MLLAVLCEWQDASSKIQILEALMRNRENAGDLEGAVWFGEKHLAAEKYRFSFLSRLAQKSAKGKGEELKAMERVTSDLGIFSLLKVAEWYARLGDRPKARQKIAEVESIVRRLQSEGDRRSFVAGTLPMIYPTLARAYILTGDISGSREALNRWRAGPESLSSEGLNLTPVFLASLSEAYAKVGEYTEAKRLAETVLKSVDKASSVGQASRLPALMSLAQTAIGERNGAAALQYLREFEEAIARLLQAEGGKVSKSGNRESDRAIRDAVNYVGRTRGRWLFGQAYLLAGQPQEAATEFLAAVEIIENLRGFVGVNDRLTFFGRHAGPYHSLVESLLSLDEGQERPRWKGLDGLGRSFAELAFYYAEAARARLLSEQMARSQATGGEGDLPPEMAQRERELRDKADAELLGGILFADSPAYREFRAFVDGLRKAYPDYAALKYPVPVTASQVPLRDGEVLLAYSLLDQRVAVWLLQRGQEPRVFRIQAGRERILKAIQAMRASLEPDSGGSLPPFDSQASGDLYQWLLAEPLKVVPPGSRIIVIPDSTLATIPFEALTTRAADRAIEFAGSTYAFTYAPSATVLTHQRKYESPDSLPPAQARLLAVGDPVYHEADPRARKTPASVATGWTATRGVALRDYSQKRSLGFFSRLPWTNLEVKHVASALGVPAESPDIRAGLDANEHDLKALNLSSYRLLHFATHGVLAGDLPYLKQPALVLSQVGDLKGEDGFLTMEEVLNLKLRASLTVLSACQTGLGQEVSGEGVVGLMRAFLYAGSRSVLVSLWRVEDESTATLMTMLYQYVAQGLPVAKALSRAKQDLRTDRGGRFAHAFYWAPFILFGPD